MYVKYMSCTTVSFQSSEAMFKLYYLGHAPTDLLSKQHTLPIVGMDLTSANVKLYSISCQSRRCDLLQFWPVLHGHP